GLAGAAFASRGIDGLVVPGLLKIRAFILVAALIGMALRFLLMIATYWTFRNSTPARVSGLFKRLHFLSASAYSLGHGGNDAQKTMGIVFIVMISSGNLAPETAEPPLWIVLACQVAMGLGTLMGGWRIVKTMGQK